MSRLAVVVRHSWASTISEVAMAPVKLTYTVTEAAVLLGISRTTAYECVHRGEIPSLTLGRRILITRAQLEHLLGPLTATSNAS